MNSLKFLLVIGFTVLSVSSQVNAQSIPVQGAEVLRVGCGVETSACFAIIAEPVGPAACTSALISFDGTTASGKNALATLLTIRAAGFTANFTLSDSLCNGPNPRMIAVTAN